MSGQPVPPKSDPRPSTGSEPGVDLKQARGRAQAEDGGPKALDLIVGRLDVVVGSIGPELVKVLLRP